MPRPSFFHHLHPPSIPWRESRFTYTFGLGGLAVFLFLVLCLTGALALFYYVPGLEEANESVQALTFLVPYGWLVRGLHYWAAQALVVVSVLHLLRVALTGAYKRPRRFNWLLGMILLVAILFLNFTGYALRWDQDIAWALLVGTNLLKSIPALGPAVYGSLVGGPEIGASTVVRFYGWHIFGLAVPAFILIAWHIFRVRRDGGISHVEEESQPPRFSRDDLVPREGLAALIATVVLFALTMLFPPSLAPAAGLGRPQGSPLPDDPAAPWFFIWVQELLRLGDPFIMGVLIPSVILAALFLIPYLIDRRDTGAARWFNPEGRVAQWIALGIVIVLTGLTIVGAMR